MVIPIVTFDQAKQKIAGLVAKYESLPTRALNKYDEENTKKDFVLPLFSYLGWDVENINEVTAEERASSGRVDYAFKLGGVSKFYVEVKPLRDDLSDKVDWAKQAITYAENKGVTWAVLTNFRQLMVFNAEWDKPNLDDARFLNLTHKDYTTDFDKTWWLSKKSVEKGVLNEEARKVGKLKPKLPVEKSLYDQLLKWRAGLFNQIYRYHKDKGFTMKQTDELIQQFINRLIFIRSAEDRGIEENKLRAVLQQWRSAGRKGELIGSVRSIFHNFADLYDSDLFPTLDAWDAIFVQSDTLEEIIQGLYERKSRLAGYDFAAIDADILGAVYEQYLGYVAQVAQEQAKKQAAQARLFGFEEPVFELEAKQLKRKQQGIYYTPKFVVDYIVKETAGRFIKERSHNEIVNMKILDPACGSGSFLIRAYAELLSYHAYQKGKSPSELDQWERLPILTRNIFGVDLDRQAVEIARLNLLLHSLARRETLPSLADNIREGNSLISGTKEELKSYFGDNWEENKPFNWEEEFKDIMANGGFDVVIGNPPWVFTRDVDFGKPMKRYFSDHYVGASGKVNSYALFVWRGVNLLRPNGLFSMIIPNTFLRATTYEDIRRNLLENYSLHEITDAGPDVFSGVTASTAILIIRKDKRSRKVRVSSLSKTGRSQLINSVSTRTVLKAPAAVISIYADKTFDQIVSRLETYCKPLSTYIQYLISGIQTWKQHKSNFIADRKLSAAYKPLLEGKDIGRYELHFAGKYILYDKKVLNVMQDERIFRLKEKILIQRVGGGRQPVRATLDTDSYYTFNSINTLVCRELDNRYVLGCLNSKLMSWFYSNKFTNRSALTVNISAKFLRNLPIPPIDLSDLHQRKRHDDLVALVDRMLELNKRLAPIRNTACSEREELLREIKRTDEEIDNLVYDLYGLTEEERRIVEETTKA